MVRKEGPIVKQGFFALIILSVFISFSIILSCPNSMARAITDEDELEGPIGFENDKFRNATVIRRDKYTNLNCHDDDWYKVNVSDLGEIVAANLKVTIKFIHRNGDLDLTLYSTNASPNNYNFLDISGLTTNEEVVSASVPPGDYLIRVYGYRGVKNKYEMNIEILYPCQYVTYDWIDITNGEEALLLEDDDYKEIPISFDFKFYDQIYNKVKVSSNGYLTFAEQTIPYFNPISPTPISSTHRDAPPISIFSYWMNLCPDLGGGIFYKTDDLSNPKCKRLIVEWRDIPGDSTGGVITFQAVLFECTNQILLQYKDVIFSSQNDGYSLGSGATIGITNGRKTTSSINRISTQFLYKDQSLSEQAALMFTPSLVEPLRILSSDLIGNDVQILPSYHQINLLFSQYIDGNILNDAFSIDPSVNGDWVVNQNRIIFTHPDNPFDYKASYEVTLYPDKIRDCFENSLQGDTNYTFIIDANQPHIEVSPTSLSFGNVVVNEKSSSLEIVISNTGNAILDISRLTVEGQNIANFSPDLTGGSNPLGNPPATIPEKGNRLITVTFTPDSMMNFDASLTIKSNDPDSPSIFISLNGAGIPKPEPHIEVSPSYHNFENVWLEDSSTLILTISNNGNADLNIHDLTLTDEENFFCDLAGGPKPLVNLPATIHEKENRTIAVTFTPSNEGTFNTVLDVTSDDPDTPKIDVPIKGTGLSIPAGWTTYDPGICFGPDDCLADPIITALMLDANETLWIGTKEGGICAYSLYTGAFSCFDEGNGLAGNSVVDIAIGPQGELWVATDIDISGNEPGVSRFNSSSGMFESYNLAQMGTFDCLWISDIAIDNNSHLWVATQSSGLLEFDGLDWNHYKNAGNYIMSLDVDSSGRIWIGTDLNGLFVKEPSESTPKRTNFELGLGDRISKIATDPNGNLWIVINDNSLSFSCPDSLKSQNSAGFWSESIPVPNSLANTVINDIFIHPNTGKLFIASDNGFYLYDGETYDHFSVMNSGLNSLYVNSIIVDPYNDYWIGTEEGLSHFNSAPPYIIEVVYGDNNKTDNLPIDTNIFVNFSEPMDRNSTEAFFEMINIEKNGGIINGSVNWNKEFNVINFVPDSSLEYSSDYEIRIFKEATDRAGMSIDPNVCEGDDYCSYFISTKDKPKSEKKPSTNQYGQYTGYYNWPNYNYNLNYWSEYPIGKSFLTIPSNNLDLQFKFNPYSNYQLMRIPKVQTSPYTNFNTWNLFSPSYYNNYTKYDNYIKDIYQTNWSSLEGLSIYSNFYKNP